jgi:DNA repair photolyase
MQIQELTVKSILVPSKLPDADYVVNPYTGCQFGCLYCYASFMGRFVKEPVDRWGAYVAVKTNAVTVCEAELKRWSPARRRASILLSSVTDPYHGIEATYRLTRGILEIFAREAYPGKVSILTKSPLVLRDVEVLRQLPQVEVGLTVTTTDDHLSRLLEVRAPRASRRLRTLQQLHAAGLTTYAFVGPLLPYFRYRPDLLEALFAHLARAGVHSVYVEHLNLKAYITQRLWKTLQHAPPEVQVVYREATTPGPRRELEDLVATLIEKYQLTLRHAKVLSHDTEQAPPEQWTTGRQPGKE